MGPSDNRGHTQDAGDDSKPVVTGHWSRPLVKNETETPASERPVYCPITRIVTSRKLALPVNFSQNRRATGSLKPAKPAWSAYILQVPCTVIVGVSWLISTPLAPLGHESLTPVPILTIFRPSWYTLVRN